MTIKRKTLSILALGCAATACTSVADKELAGYQDPGFGEANRATFAAMVINPDPQYDNPIPPTSAEHAAQAIDRYRNDAVKQPRTLNTQNIGGGGNGGGGNGGGGNGGGGNN
ncbi:MAG: hypothetical protein ABJ239_09935 [Erythrobacter sp.]